MPSMRGCAQVSFLKREEEANLSEMKKRLQQ
jgi:hypothetical protein